MLTGNKLRWLVGMIIILFAGMEILFLSILWAHSEKNGLDFLANSFKVAVSDEYKVAIPDREIELNPERKLSKYKSIRPTNYTASQLLDTNRGVKVVSSDIFPSLVNAAKGHPRRRKMFDLTKNPEENNLQTLINVWSTGSYAPVHKHLDYSEAFVVLEGALAFFNFDESGNYSCKVISNLNSKFSKDRLIIVEKNEWHALTAAPTELGWPGFAVVFEAAGHKYDRTKPVKIEAPFVPSYGNGLEGDPEYYKTLFTKCPLYEKS